MLQKYDVIVVGGGHAFEERVQEYVKLCVGKRRGSRSGSLRFKPTVGRPVACAIREDAAPRSARSEAALLGDWTRRTAGRGTLGWVKFLAFGLGAPVSCLCDRRVPERPSVDVLALSSKQKSLRKTSLVPLRIMGLIVSWASSRWPMFLSTACLACLKT
jgi:hypothetical protein